MRDTFLNSGASRARQQSESQSFSKAVLLMHSDCTYMYISGKKTPKNMFFNNLIFGWLITKEDLPKLY